MIKLNLNLKVLLLFFTFLIISLKCHADNSGSKKDIVTLGSDKAPVKIKIFSSLTCPHCANFHTNVLPKIKKEYVDSGKVQLIFIDFPLDQVAFDASKLLHCLDQEKQIKFLDKIYENQKEWTSGLSMDEVKNNLKKIVKALGINSEEFDRCIKNEVIADKIINARIDGQREYSINSTPTIVINEKKFEGEVNFKNIKKKIEKLI